MINLQSLIIYEDKDLIVINKPAGLVIHEGAGDVGTTLVDLMLNKYPEMSKLNWEDKSRPGIVHRLDKDTSGLIVVAKNPETLNYLQKQFHDRMVEKSYMALVLGKVEPSSGEIKISISRHLKDRKKMSVSYLGEGKPSITKYQTARNYKYKGGDLTLLKVHPETGRMHQIRVHLKHKGYPVIGDQTYNTKISKRISKELNLNRQFLHAYSLKIKIPSGDIKDFRSDLPQEFQKLLYILHKV